MDPFGRPAIARPLPTDCCSQAMSAAKPSQLDLLDNVVPAIHRARRELAEARTRDEILEIRERAAAALEAAERIAGDAPTHGAISDALGHLISWLPQPKSSISLTTNWRPIRLAPCPVVEWQRLIHWRANQWRTTWLGRPGRLLLHRGLSRLLRRPGGIAAGPFRW